MLLDRDLRPICLQISIPLFNYIIWQSDLYRLTNGVAAGSYQLLKAANNNKNNKSFISSRWTYTNIHPYFNSLRYNRKAHQKLEMLFIHHYTSSRKTIRPGTANVDKNKILDQICIMKQTTWVISGRPQFTPLYIINSRNYSTHWIIKSINKLIVIWKKCFQMYLLNKHPYLK